MPVDRDLLVVGAGPAGRALTFRAARAGLRVILVDPAPERPWRATYGAWTDELPTWLDPGCVAAAAASAVVYTPGLRVIKRGYTILDTAALQEKLSGGGEVIAASATYVGSRTVTLDTGESLTATTVIDARGNARARPGTPRQTAVGVRQHTDVPEMVVMDWRRPTAADEGTFSYRVAVGPSVELVEETCLAGTPPVDTIRLAALSAARTEARTPDISGADPDVELVDFALLPAVDPPWRRRGDDALRFGAAGGLMHPATGYSVAATLSAVDTVVAALSEGRDAHTALWPMAARTVYQLRAIGLIALLDMTPAELTHFFDTFFALPVAAQHAYLSSRADVAGVVGAMLRIFVALPWRARVRLVRRFVGGTLARAFARMT
ncbi:lycopene beta-cyclase [Gordonia effusa NBRC 100432]|uniref:Lycopene beta-cyclase n=1 Tax=Gordonia effusa NBRC 100432 TaxID=1077974 RepID=H0R608_9ACTN|nr:lycopene cyclase family protein [Gordonia effusa]GAB20509.1 lycopene beta-cyclase [Gordonia effusa NBRC 100432]